MIKRLIQVFLKAEFLRFAVVGTIGAAIDFGTYGLMTRVLGLGAVYCLGLLSGGASYIATGAEVNRVIDQCGAAYPLVIANMISVFLAIISNFLLNKFWTFRDTRTANIAVQGFGYFVMSVIAWILNQALTGFFAGRIAILQTVFTDKTDVVAKVLAILIVLFYNFFVSKLLIFRKAKKQSPAQVT